MKRTISVWLLLTLIFASLIYCSQKEATDKTDEDTVVEGIGWIEYDGIRHIVLKVDEIDYELKPDFNNEEIEDVECIFISLRTLDDHNLSIAITGKNFDIYNNTYSCCTDEPTQVGSFDVWLFDREEGELEYISSKAGETGWMKTEGKKGNYTITAEFDVEDWEGDHDYLKGGRAKMNIKIQY